MLSSVNSGVSQQIVYPATEAPAQKMVKEVLVDVVGNKLSLPDFAALAQVCKVWQKMILPNIEKKLLEEVSFGKDKWLSIPGIWDVSEEHAVTEDQKNVMIAKLKGKCTFFNESDFVQPHRF